jgi:hypothetical protein
VDLQPRLRELEAKAQVFAVFDACYSGQSVRSVEPDRTVSKYLRLENPGVQGTPQRDDSDAYAQSRLRASADQGYPYRNVIYLSASATAQRAYDIPQAAIDAGDEFTVDGQAHGELTNALLHGLQGEADANHDGTITYRELYDFVLRMVNKRQTPQLLYPDRSVLADSPVFEVKTAPIPPPHAPRSPAVRVKLVGSADRLAPRLRGRPNIELSDRVHDLAVSWDGREYTLFIGGGAEIASYASSEVDELIKRVLLEPDVRRLVDLNWPQQDFNVRLAVESGNRDFLIGDRLKFVITPESASYLLLLNIDISGYVTVIYPREVSQLQPVTMGTPVLTEESRIEGPVGTEYMKVFAFKQKPPGFEEWVGKDFAPSSSEFRRLLQFLSTAAGGRAQSSLLIYSGAR